MDGSGVLKGLLEAVNSPRASEGSRVENYGQAAFANVARCHDILYIYIHTGVARDSAKRMHTPKGLSQEVREGYMDVAYHLGGSVPTNSSESGRTCSDLYSLFIQ